MATKTVYVLLEGDYYDHENRPRAVVSSKELAEEWSNYANVNSYEELLFRRNSVCL